jgi:hypothetical protein
MLRTLGDRKRWQQKGVVKTHKIANQEEAEQNLKSLRNRPQEEGWFSSKAEEGRSRSKARNNEPTALNVESPCRKLYIAGNAVWQEGSMGKSEQLATRWIALPPNAPPSKVQGLKVITFKSEKSLQQRQLMIFLASTADLYSLWDEFLQQRMKCFADKLNFSTRRISWRISSVTEDYFFVTVLNLRRKTICYILSAKNFIHCRRNLPHRDNTSTAAAKSIRWLQKPIPLSQHFNFFECFHTSEKNITYRSKKSYTKEDIYPIEIIIPLQQIKKIIFCSI